MHTIMVSHQLQNLLFTLPLIPSIIPISILNNPNPLNHFDYVLVEYFEMKYFLFENDGAPILPKWPGGDTVEIIIVRV